MTEGQVTETVSTPVSVTENENGEIDKRLNEIRHEADLRVIRAELKVEAIRAGMIDLDGLRLVDISKVRLNEAGELEGGSEVMAQTKRAKPWLFSNGSTSSGSNVPPAQPSRPKLATEMSDAEYREARAALLRYRG